LKNWGENGGRLVGENETKKMVGGLVGENETKTGPRAGNIFNLLCQRENVQIN